MAAKSRIALQDSVDWLTVTQLSPTELESYGDVRVVSYRVYIDEEFVNVTQCRPRSHEVSLWLLLAAF